MSRGNEENPAHPQIEDFLWTPKKSAILNSGGRRYLRFPVETQSATEASQHTALLTALKLVGLVQIKRLSASNQRTHSEVPSIVTAPSILGSGIGMSSWCWFELARITVCGDMPAALPWYSTDHTYVGKRLSAFIS